MAINCDPSSLAAAANCFSCVVPPGDQIALQTYLLAQIALNLGAVTSADPSTLANAATGFMQTIPPGMQLAVQSYLLCLLVNK
jgi:hypothetical protein